MKSLLIVLMMLAGVAQAQEISVKGLTLGMSAEEFTAKFGKKVYDDGSAGVTDYNTNFSIAGVERANPNLRFDKNKRLGEIMFFFKPHEFHQVKAAFASKYQLKCQTSTVQNALRQSFDQEECSFVNQAGDSIFIQKRFQRDDGYAVMLSRAIKDQRQAEASSSYNKARKDI